MDDVRPDELAAEARIARELEGIAGQAGAAFSADFVDRVMAAVEAEPVPAPARAAGHALRHGAIGAFLASFADAWRVTTRSGFPVAVRAQALALVLVVVGLAAGSGVATAGALGFMQGEAAVPSPQPSIDVRARRPTGTRCRRCRRATEEPTTQPPASVEPVGDRRSADRARRHAEARRDRVTATAVAEVAPATTRAASGRRGRPSASGGSGGDDDGGDDGHGGGGDHSGPGGGGDDDGRHRDAGADRDARRRRLRPRRQLERG